MDKRSEANRQTRVSIARALLHLLGSREFSDITVTDIVEEAHVARASYYRNFSSKEDILVNAGRLIMDDFGKAIGEIEGGCLSYEGVVLTFRYFREYRIELLRLHEAGFTSIYERLFQEYVACAAKGRIPRGMLRYGVSFYTGALFNVYVRWLENGMKESPERMASLFYTMMAAAFESVGTSFMESDKLDKAAGVHRCETVAEER
ncbi:MAG: TetR/AcrR family transcriptional regulator [Slackia sp.]